MTGKGLMSSEYIAATKGFGKKLKVTAGLGWGRLGSHGGIGQPFGTRPALSPDDFGKPTTDPWLRAAPAPLPDLTMSGI